MNMDFFTAMNIDHAVDAKNGNCWINLEKIHEHGMENVHVANVVGTRRTKNAKDPNPNHIKLLITLSINNAVAATNGKYWTNL